MEIKVEKQIQRRGSRQFQTNSASSSSIRRPNRKREGVVQPKPYMHAKAKPLKAKKGAHTNRKGKFEFEPSHDRDIKCLQKGHIASQCPNRRGNGEVEYESDRSESEDMSSLKDCSDEKITYPVVGEALVKRRALNMQIKNYDVDHNGKHISHSKPHQKPGM
jgi:hypothetical protein